MWTKRQLVEEAYAEIGIAAYVFDLESDELQTGLRRLDSMMATWEAKGVRIGYAMPSGPTTSSLDDASGIPDAANETVVAHLAIRLAPGFGKQVSPDTRKTARDGYDTLLWAAARPIEQQLPSTLPRGAGQKPWRTTDDPFFPPPEDSPLGIAPGGDLDILPE